MILGQTVFGIFDGLIVFRTNEHDRGLSHMAETPCRRFVKNCHCTTAHQKTRQSMCEDFRLNSCLLLVAPRRHSISVGTSITIHSSQRELENCSSVTTDWYQVHRKWQRRDRQLPKRFARNSNDDTTLAFYVDREKAIEPSS